MLIQAFPSGPFETNAYVFASCSSRKGVIIDPAPGSFPFIREYCKKNELQLELILLTHSHLDHIADVKQCKEYWSIPVKVHSLDAPNLERPGADGLPLFLECEGVKTDGYLEEKEQITIGSLLLEVITTPGHSPGSVCFYCAEKKVLFSGDTLFQGTIGNLSFPSSVPKKMWHSLKKLALLPGEVIVYPGHGFPTTIQNEQNLLSRAEELFS